MQFNKFKKARSGSHASKLRVGQQRHSTRRSSVSQVQFVRYSRASTSLISMVEVPIWPSKLADCHETFDDNDENHPQQVMVSTMTTTPPATPPTPTPSPSPTSSTSTLASTTSSATTTTPTTTTTLSSKNTTTPTTTTNPSATRPTAKLDEREDDERHFQNLILRERRFEEAQASLRVQPEPVLCGQLRHSLLSWMLRICEHQLCQDEIFPLATMILDKFLLINPVISISRQKRHQRRHSHNYQQWSRLHQENNHHHHHQQQHHHHFEDSDDGDDDDSRSLQSNSQLCASGRELEQRQLLLFATCSLLLATKLRQTPRLYIQTLIEFSRPELPVELGREEIIDGELLMLSMLKWDLAALATPNEFLQELLARKCNPIIMNFLDQTTTTAMTGVVDCDALAAQDNPHRQQQGQQWLPDGGNKCKLVDRVNRHTQTLLELCLMASSSLCSPTNGFCFSLRQTTIQESTKASLAMHSDTNQLYSSTTPPGGHTRNNTDSQLSQYPSSVLAMSSMAVAINGLSATKSAYFGLEQIVAQIHESTSKVNELELMIDVAFQIEKYVQTLLHSTND